MPIADSQAAAMERLRMEFVKRVTRPGNGSLLEEQLADAVTARLRDFLPHLEGDLEPLLHEAFARIADAAGQWSNVNIDLSVSRQSFNALWEIPNRQSPMRLAISEAAFTSRPAPRPDAGAAALQNADQFLEWARESLPTVAMDAYAAEIRIGRPVGAKLKETHDYVVNQWRVFGKSMAERWRSAVLAVEKQTTDWLRVAAFTFKLVEGVSANQEAIDQALETREIGWSLDRQVSVDRCILRMAAYELLYLEGIPASATINDAVEMAKKYSTAESGKFVNGILGAIVSGVAAHNGIPDHEDQQIEVQDDDIDSLVEADEPVEEELAHA
jgi:N utilization substance protein B